MQTASVVQAALADHPRSGKRRLRVTVDSPWLTVGQGCATTDVWCDDAMPQPSDSESISWGEYHVWYRGVRYAKHESDSPSNAPLH